MSQFFKTILLISSLSFSAMSQAELTCKTIGVASCQTTEGFCVEFIDVEGTNTDTWKRICDAFIGEFSSYPCDISKSILTCLNQDNFAMPIMRFDVEFGRKEASQMCNALGGQICL